jgi:hypothetical protein
VDGVRQRIEQTGAELRYLPPYSPDFNPIEKCWFQVNQRLWAWQVLRLDLFEGSRRLMGASGVPSKILFASRTMGLKRCFGRYFCSDQM